MIFFKLSVKCQTFQEIEQTLTCVSSDLPRPKPGYDDGRCTLPGSLFFAIKVKGKTKQPVHTTKQIKQYISLLLKQEYSDEARRKQQPIRELRYIFPLYDFKFIYKISIHRFQDISLSFFFYFSVSQRFYCKLRSY